MIREHQTEKAVAEDRVSRILDPYPITEVLPEWIREGEEMGSKRKFWYVCSEPGEETEWLFKFPQPNTGQHWAEKIAAGVASVLEIPHARVELAVLSEHKGSVTKSFADNGRELVHGNQILEWKVRGYDPERRFRQSSHTLANIWKVLDHVFVMPEGARDAKVRMAKYVVLDAVIGNTDRHHENWGVLRTREGNRWVGRVAPSFDHASSLGRELLDSRRSRLLREGRVAVYAEKGRGAVYWSEDERRGPSPLELTRRATRDYPDLFCPGLVKLERLDVKTINDQVDRVPTDWMSPTARDFAIELMRYNVEQLSEMFR